MIMLFAFIFSDAKGSFAYAASPHGDSFESNGKPGSSLCRETNTADNLMLLGGDNNDVVEEKNIKRGTKRTNTSQSKPLLPTDGHNNAKQAEDSVLSRLGVKSQAYVRRNRSKPCREITSIRSPDSKGVVQEKQADKQGTFSVSGFKQTGEKCGNATKSTASDAQVAIKLDGIQIIRGSDCLVKNEATHGDDRSKAIEVLPKANGKPQHGGTGVVVAAGESVETPDSTSNVVLRTSYSSAKSTHHARETHGCDEKVEASQLDKGMIYIHAGELDNSGISPFCVVEAGTYPHCEESINMTNDHADGNINQVDMKIVGKSHADLDISKLSNKCVKECGQLEGFNRSTSAKQNSNYEQPEVRTTVHVKDEMEACDSAIVAPKDTCHPSLDHSPALPKNPLPEKSGSNMESEIKISGGNLDRIAQKEYGDSILKSARLIEVSIKRAGEQSTCNISLEKRTKVHWNFVLEEMAWMANDFMQERLWKNMTAAQVSHWIVSDGRAKFEEASIQRKRKDVTRGLFKGIVSFWHSAEALRTAGRTTGTQEHNSNILEKTERNGTKAEKSQGNESLETEKCSFPHQSQIQDYAVRFLEYNSQTSESLLLAEAPPTPDRLNDFGMLKVSDLSEGSLFYTVEPGAMLAYRECVESLFVHHKKIGNTGLKDDYEASACDSAADMPQENLYEDEGETCTYSSEAYDNGLLSQMGHRKHLGWKRFNGGRSYEISTDLPFEPCLESKSGSQPLLSNGKRPSSFLAVPTKRIRTASRQRIVSPFPAGIGGNPQITSKTDVSSGDTSSYQDDQSSLHRGSMPWKNMDFESTVDFDRQLTYDGSEVYTKVNKKKKHKNSGYNKNAQNAANSCVLASVKGRIYDQLTQADLFSQYDRNDFLKKKPDTQQFDSKWNIAHGGQHTLKKLKLMRQGIDISQEASPVASQMSNISNSAKIIKIITNRDRGRKGKALKMASSGGWSNFEDQALVVLVHDLGQNWELVSDAINSIVQFKSVYRQPKGCQERYKVLVDKNFGDGADSAEDSGSSQHYHFTLPGIPRGSARQLFQRLQGPIEEENLKAHFEKIILLMRQLHSRRRKGNSQELKSIIQPHSSHVAALTQACLNNLSGVTLTPLDLCDAISSNPDAVTPGSGYLGSHTNGLTPPNHHGSIGPNTPNSSLNPRLTGSPGMVLGSNLLSPSALSAPLRDAQKHAVPRCASLQADEQQKIQYNQMLSGRNLQQPGGSVPGAFPPGVDHGVRLIPSAHGMGMVTGLNRVNVHPGAMSAPGNSILRPHDPMQVSQGNSQAVSCMNQSFSNATVSSPAQSFPIQQPQQTHQVSQPSHMFGNTHHSQTQGTSHSGPQQQTHAMRLVKERQIQQRMVPQQHNDLPGASAVPSVQNGSQGQQQQQQQSPTASSAPSQPQHQWQQSAQNPPDSYALPNQPANATQHKQKKGQQQPRQNQQQRNQGSQQAKLMKSLGRGNMLIPQTTVDTAPANVVSASSKKQISENKLVQHGQGTLPGAGIKTSSPSRPHPGNLHKLYISPSPQSPKQLQDIGNQGVRQGSPSQPLLTSQQLPLHSKSPSTTPQQQHRQINSSQTSIQRMMMHQNLLTNSDCRTDPQTNQVQHNQMISTPIPRSTDSGSPGVSSINQQKHDASNDSTAVASTSMMLSSQDTFVGNKTLLSPSNQDVLERQIPSDFQPMYGQEQTLLSNVKLLYRCLRLCAMEAADDSALNSTWSVITSMPGVASPYALPLRRSPPQLVSGGDPQAATASGGLPATASTCGAEPLPHLHRQRINEESPMARVSSWIRRRLLQAGGGVSAVILLPPPKAAKEVDSLGGSLQKESALIIAKLLSGEDVAMTEPKLVVNKVASLVTTTSVGDGGGRGVGSKRWLLGGVPKKVYTCCKRVGFYLLGVPVGGESTLASPWIRQELRF
ncbi:hypothetical protein GUJ93_ZPchr0010g7291 [Zizania palustris]|uniref:Myb-like domain-containing protein n=1 Tax=Zizania palustris TaxID=103762 RepID=A0A8J6BJT1_ZIZPA|nr:hypothetical protein GUJ93_ZPchr0010g7291 [Zizania palustris]